MVTNKLQTLCRLKWMLICKDHSLQRQACIYLKWNTSAYKHTVVLVRSIFDTTLANIVIYNMAEVKKQSTKIRRNHAQWVKSWILQRQARRTFPFPFLFFIFLHVQWSDNLISLAYKPSPILHAKSTKKPLVLTEGPDSAQRLTVGLVCPAIRLIGMSFLWAKLLD